MSSTTNNKGFSLELLELFQTKKSKKAIQRLLEENYSKRTTFSDDLEDINIDNNKRLYAFLGLFEKKFFDTEEELSEYLKQLDIIYGDVFIIDYLGERYSFKDTIRLINKNSNAMILTIINEDVCAEYNYERSISQKEHVWNLVAGGMNSVYKAFKDRGIDIKYDIFNAEDEMCELAEEQHFDVLTASSNRTFVVDSKMAEEFKNIKPDPKITSERNKILKRVKINVEK